MREIVSSGFATEFLVQVSERYKFRIDCTDVRVDCFSGLRHQDQETNVNRLDGRRPKRTSRVVHRLVSVLYIDVSAFRETAHSEVQSMRLFV